MRNRISARIVALTTLAALAVAVVLVRPDGGDHHADRPAPVPTSTVRDGPAAPGTAVSASRPVSGTAGPSMLPPETEADPAEPVVDAVSKTSTGFLSRFLSYGYPDRHATGYLERSRPYMTKRLYQSWSADADRADGDSDPEWVRMQTLHQRQIIAVTDVEIASLTDTGAIVQLVFKAGTVTARADGRVVGRIPDAAYHRKVALKLTLADGRWKVDDYSPVDMG